MNNRFKTIVILLAMSTISCNLGCSNWLKSDSGKSKSTSVSLETKFSQINIKQTNSSQVLSMLPSQKMLHTTDSVSVLQEQGRMKELGIIQFDSVDATVDRKTYLKLSSKSTIPPFTKEKLYLLVDTTISSEILNQPFENGMRKKIAILKHIHSSIVEDAKPYLEDQQTVSMVGLIRIVIDMGINELAKRPRDASDLQTAVGFSYEHPTLGKTFVRLNEMRENVYRLTINASDTVDSVSAW